MEGEQTHAFLVTPCVCVLTEEHHVIFHIIQTAVFVLQVKEGGMRRGWEVEEERKGRGGGRSQVNNYWRDLNLSLSYIHVHEHFLPHAQTHTHTTHLTTFISSHEGSS